MTTDEWKEMLEIIESIMTILGIAGAGFWGYFLYKRQREDRPHIEFSADIVLHKKSGDWWIAELLAYVENKGKVQHILYNLEFDLATLNSEDEVNISGKYGNQVEFPNLVSKGSFLPSRFNYFFIEPGVKAKYSYLTRIPANAALAIMHIWFKYADGKHSHSAEITKVIPNN